MYEAYHPAAFSSIQTIDNQTRWKRTPARKLLQKLCLLFGSEMDFHGFSLRESFS
jgi:hypothetical protein